MTENVRVFCLAVAVLLILTAPVMAIEKEASNIRPESDLTDRAVVGGSNELTGADQPFFGPSGFGSSPQSRGDIVGMTHYEYQHNGTMGRQIVLGNRDEEDWVHFVWMWRSSPTAIRKIRYNAYNRTVGSWPLGNGSDPAAGEVISGNNGGYCTIDINSAGVPIAAWHEGLANVYFTHVGRDTNPPFGIFSKLQMPGPPNCEGAGEDGYELESDYIWPVVEYDNVGGDDIYHIISSESPGGTPEPPAATIQSYIYYRLTNEVLDQCPAGTENEDLDLGRWMDEGQNIHPTVRSDPNSDKVAIVYLKELYPDGHAGNDCPDNAVQWKHDVAYFESNDGGVTWPGTPVNVTDYTEGLTLAMSEIKYSAYTDLTALYDSEGHLHIVWNTPVWVADGTCGILYQAMMWHWDDSRGQITPVYDATLPESFYPGPGECPNTGTWNIMVSKPNISECDGNLYVSFTRFGAHPDVTDGYPNDSVGGDFSDENLLNGDIYLTASSDGGKCWGPDPAAPLYTFPGTAGTGVAVKKGTAVNVTNTYTPLCVAGDCHSEHWATMAKYSTDSVHIAYIDDHDAGEAINVCGEWTENPYMYMKYPCFDPEGTLGYNVQPANPFVPIAPNGVPDCTIPYTDTFSITIMNTGNVDIHYDAVAAPTWLMPVNASGDIESCVGATSNIVYTVGPIPSPEGEYPGTITINLTSSAGNDVAVINVTAHVECKYYVPEYALISTSCWSVGVWNVPRSGVSDREDEGNMFWFVEEIAPMYDNGVIISYVSDLDNTYFSMFDGSDSHVDFIAMGPLVVEKAEYPDYEYAHGQWATPDESILGYIEYFTPRHGDTCVLIERFTVTNNTASPITIHVGEGIDWDFPDVEDPVGSDNSSGVGEGVGEGMVYQTGPATTANEDYCGGVLFTRPITGAIVLENDVWVYPNKGYVPADIGALLGSHTGFIATDSVEDLNSVYVVDPNLTLAPGECKAYCKVKASSLDGLGNEDGSETGTLYNLIDKGKIWAADRYLDEEACYPTPTGFDPDSTIMKHNTLPPAKSAEDWVGTGWHELFPTFCENTTVIEAQDNGTPGLQYCDYLKFRQDAPPNEEWWEHVRWVTWTIEVTPIGGGDPIFFDMFRGWPNQVAGTPPYTTDAFSYPWRSFWVETGATGLGQIIEIVGWEDNGNGYLDFCDIIVVMVMDWPWCYIEIYHVEDVAVDIWTVKQDPPPPTCVIGDANGSGAVDIDDVVYLIQYIFAGGPAPIPMGCCGDANGSGAIDIDDVVYLIQYIFAGGPVPDPTACDPPWLSD